MNTIIYPICCTCRHPLLILKIYVDYNSELLIHFNCKCKYNKRTLYFHEYYSELLYYNGCHEAYYIGYPLISYCYQCTILLDQFTLPYHLNHTLMYHKNKKLFKNCKFHRKKITNFCINCSKGLCDYYRKTIHSTHSIISIKDFYNEVKQKIEIFQKNREKFMKKLFVNNKKHMNLKCINSLNLLYKLYFDCFDSKIGYGDTTLMNNIKNLLDMKEIYFYPFLIKKPFLNKPVHFHAHGNFPIVSNLMETFFKNPIILLVTMLNNNKIAIEYLTLEIDQVTSKKRCVIQIYDNTLIKLEKEIEIFGIVEEMYSVYNENVLLIFEEDMELWDFNIPRKVKSYKESLSIYGYSKSLVEPVTLFDSKTIFYKFSEEYLHLDLEKNEIIHFNQYGFFTCTIANIVKMNNRNIMLIHHDYIEIVDWYKKKELGCFRVYGRKRHNFFYPFIFYPKKYIITAIRDYDTLDCFIICWNEMTLKQKYLTKLSTRNVSNIYKLNQKEILIVSDHYTSYCRFDVDSGQVTEIFKFYSRNKMVGSSFFNDTLFILEENAIYYEKIPKFR